MKTYKGNPTYFERKAGSLEEIVSKINEANPKPEVFDLRNESEEYASPDDTYRQGSERDEETEFCRQKESI